MHQPCKNLKNCNNLADNHLIIVSFFQLASSVVIYRPKSDLTNENGCYGIHAGCIDNDEIKFERTPAFFAYLLLKYNYEYLMELLLNTYIKIVLVIYDIFFEEHIILVNK